PTTPFLKTEGGIMTEYTEYAVEPESVIIPKPTERDVIRALTKPFEDEYRHNLKRLREQMAKHYKLLKLLKKHGFEVPNPNCRWHVRCPEIKVPRGRLPELRRLLGRGKTTDGLPALRSTGPGEVEDAEKRLVWFGLRHDDYPEV